MKTYHILLGLPISDISLEDVCLLAEKRHKNRFSMWLMADAALAMRCHKQSQVLDACLLSERIFAEGQTIRVAAAGLGSAFTEKVFSTSELLPALMSAQAGRYFFIGGRSGIARRAAVACANAARRVPCPVVGGVKGDFCRKGRENAAVLTRIWEAQPDVVLVAMEDAALWLAENRYKLPAALYIAAPSGVMAELAGCKERDEWFAAWRAFYSRQRLQRWGKAR
jgi:UDP-N-acetyl-D-mannosaminuronic acid transferase (WecB/TagA/CpsF family)